MLRIEEIVGNVDDDFRDHLLGMDDGRLRALLADSHALRHLLPLGVSYREAVTAIDAILDYRANPPEPPPAPPQPAKKKLTARQKKVPPPEPEPEPARVAEAAVIASIPEPDAPLAPPDEGHIPRQEEPTATIGEMQVTPPPPVEIEPKPPEEHVTLPPLHPRRRDNIILLLPIIIAAVLVILLLVR